ncbi:MAG: aggregation factor core [Rhodobacteraceae bacterium]|nr:aggregation factor core [Paracoccaceae bacterium]
MAMLCRSALIALTCASPALAEIQLEFIEGAPKDRFVIVNASDCRLSDAVLTIDLRTAAAPLIFDVTDAGAGVEVFQPFDILEGASHLMDMPTVRDGDMQIDLHLRHFPAWDRITFTIDMDDTQSARGTTVSFDEFQGAQALLTLPEGVTSAAFNDRARAVLQVPGCDT